MKKFNNSIFISFFCYLLCMAAVAQVQRFDLLNLNYKIYPDINDTRPELPSPFTTTDNEEYVIAVTTADKYAIIPVTLSNEWRICSQLVVGSVDFPHLSRTGLHSEEELNQVRTITGRSLNHITDLGRPNQLSLAGFLAQDEDIISVIRGDNRTVGLLNLAHPQLATPLFHVLNMMDTDLELDRWNMARHRWENIRCFFYNTCTVFVDAHDTKGGQKSIFDDGIKGGFYIHLWRDFNTDELQLLKQKYGHLTQTEFDTLKTLLSNINTGEIEPQYIMRYGFYEGHTFWRADPIAISLIFGFKSVSEIEKIFTGRLFEIMTNHFIK